MKKKITLGYFPSFKKELAHTNSYSTFCAMPFWCKLLAKVQDASFLESTSI